MNPSYEENIFSPLGKADWNFDAVPDGEIIACCLWKYARESRSIELAADSYWCNVRDMLHAELYRKDPALKAEHDKEAESIKRRVEIFHFDYEEFSNKFWESDLATIDIYQSLAEQVTDWARPWQKIPPARRARLSQQVANSFLMKPAALAMVGDLEKLWKANSTDLEEIRSKSRPVYDDSEECASYQESQPVTLAVEPGKPAGGIQVAAFTIDFARFTDREMLDEFQKWLVSNRPKEWKRPLRIFPGSSARGKKLIEFRVALERLGLMRLLHWHTPGQLKDFWPEAWTKYKRKQDSFRREVHQAAHFFRRLFPFLPSDEKPSSLERCSIWLKEMDRICAETDREYQAGGGIK